ncbi:hypothetical protein LINGRAHAP2_LOCUS29100 [Linum grandiflorum]
MIKDSPNVRNQSSNLLIGCKPQLKLRLDYQNFSQRRHRQFQTSTIINRQSLSKKPSPSLSSMPSLGRFQPWSGYAISRGCSF